MPFSNQPVKVLLNKLKSTHRIKSEKISFLDTFSLAFFNELSEQQLWIYLNGLKGFTAL